ncbi:hypothetical protein NDU88_006365 [Pleurodeles waltl]|uniref:Uncharacterized protein n=1 Tax=Pleurodeles waltl TaxID=8319 RepID=A0AAV7NQ09_PLEWA|nr:hypothetical protein NDU88_006365 [Pleurodeles waltl]
MGTPTDAREADFRSPSLKRKTDSGKGREEFSRRTPLREDEKEMPRPEKKETDNPQGLEGRAEGENRNPETSTCRLLRYGPCYKDRENPIERKGEEEEERRGRRKESLCEGSHRGEKT